VDHIFLIPNINFLQGLSLFPVLIVVALILFNIQVGGLSACPFLDCSHVLLLCLCVSVRMYGHLSMHFLIQSLCVLDCVDAFYGSLWTRLKCSLVISYSCSLKQGLLGCFRSYIFLVFYDESICLMSYCNLAHLWIRAHCGPA
jgi:hypothetical protein